MSRRLGRTAAALSAVALASVGATAAADAHGRDDAQARPDDRVTAGTTLHVGGRGVLRNDHGDLTTVVRNTQPKHGSLALNPDGSFSYTPADGFTGTDTFTYTSSDAVDLYRTDQPPLATVGGVKITGGAYGSSFTPVPGQRDEFYELTDRGPNADGPNGTKVEALPEFTPAIGKFRLVDGKATLLQTIKLYATDATPTTGTSTAR